ncbi:hypothetical protein MGG_16130 [Pyricularia oryzae 70-15]|uniref:Uncharacterized protein n=2 Tax=Pyricularia oryzae TaxID=318829 RepID=G4MRZ5_PYRO7|nr:uncharacterized protein MGG_16130 [Pyricularia oryzae 70-15]EHA56664.1 hypothetical protein MGG_16130 [Pyricularia oryzae 70-15]KAI7930128.1 hypothetical protein M9X92_000903 [Pyricularia oryzae]KAI7930265.1 hypothetical protein M0657_001734 [Pyricularia oryzae]QBZ53871.1 hypothetical protein PoMZ_09561 [Pyricularia oryzae]
MSGFGNAIALLFKLRSKPQTASTIANARHSVAHAKLGRSDLVLGSSKHTRVYGYGS